VAAINFLRVTSQEEVLVDITVRQECWAGDVTVVIDEVSLPQIEIGICWHKRVEIEHLPPLP
jgi:hypothetical protein